jgi:hypothetical protein
MSGGLHAVRVAVDRLRRNRENSSAMVWFFIEAGVALALAVFIVWFTMGGRSKPPNADREKKD